jgi:hypothetical protein
LRVDREADDPIQENLSVAKPSESEVPTDKVETLKEL